MEFNRLFNRFASLPVVFTEPRLNAELALNQVLPGMAFRIQLVPNAQPPIDALESVADELTAVIGGHRCPQRSKA